MVSYALPRIFLFLSLPKLPATTGTISCKASERWSCKEHSRVINALDFQGRFNERSAFCFGTLFTERNYSYHLLRSSRKASSGDTQRHLYSRKRCTQVLNPHLTVQVGRTWASVEAVCNSLVVASFLLSSVNPPPPRTLKS